MQTEKVILSNGVGNFEVRAGEPAKVVFETTCESPIRSAAIRIPRCEVNALCAVEQTGDRVMIEIDLQEHETIIPGGHTSYVIVAAYEGRRMSDVIARGSFREKC